MLLKVIGLFLPDALPAWAAAGSAAKPRTMPLRQTITLLQFWLLLAWSCHTDKWTGQTTGWARLHSGSSIRKPRRHVCTSWRRSAMATDD